ncbi:hypothetical protein [Amycolatopsis sp. DSM 110486]|uniref:hypothetical protein n=1 Tax=Amycolatopsis sp. DSM 110486 TaxID=2865832 RepID=UPI001C699139|nr:hypothetical protein [Amycolatopsis sp. DSM 110486]QYN22995.1 hypothetical protein K1T34_11295 [Amycolatopsis sp. DSM 110486]
MALTALGARVPVTPALAPAVRVGDVEAWPSARLGEVLDQLAARDQATLSFGLWRSEDDGHFYNEGDFAYHAELDFTQPWPELVRQAHHRAKESAQRVAPRDDLFAAISWIAQADLGHAARR